MKVCLLYPETDRGITKHYFDEKSIIQDLGLKTLFLAAAKEIEKEDGKVKLIKEADVFLEETMKKVMMAPLETEEQIVYRQEIMKDCFSEEEFICELYRFSSEILISWEKLGRRAKGKSNTRSPRNLVTDIHVMQLFVTSLGKLKNMLAEMQGKLQSKGFVQLYERLYHEFPDEAEERLRRILKDISFFVCDKEEAKLGNSKMVDKPRIVMGFRMGDGLKFEGFALESVTTESKRYRDPNSTIGRAQEYINALTTDSFHVQKDIALSGQAAQMEYQVVQYIVSCCEPFFNAFSGFFDQLHFQTAFYRGAVNLKHYMERFHLDSCCPKVGAQGTLRFRELKEFVMSIEQRIDPVGNTCDIEDKMLLIVTGANQGGKSTFLRSIGIAQIMMQCGLAVAAESYESGIFPSFFTHFTRREDSEMNSGRLGEELGRMSQIIDNLDGNSLILLNESFASTTEKEGSVIAYDIVRALTEAGVKILTVTHLLSFARKIYEETLEMSADEIPGKPVGATPQMSEGAMSRKPVGATPMGVEFLSAQRMENGRRTYKMIQHAPELTSFGLDLYDEIIGKK